MTTVTHPARIIRLPQVRSRTGLSRSTIYEHICWRRFKIEPPCRLNFEPGLMANL